MSKPILPNSTIGVFGSGQLGRMLTIEARKMGYRVHTYSPDSDTPTGQVADEETVASYEDLDRVRRFARDVDVITFEFENVPADTINAAAEMARVFPRGDILHTTQNRLREKMFLSTNGFPVTPFRHIKIVEDLVAAIEQLGTPCVLKTAGFGYDGKGQRKLTSSQDLEDAFTGLLGSEGVLEAFIDFEKEVSVVCARSQDGQFVDYCVIENEHRDHILDVSFAPANVDDSVQRAAREITRSIAEQLDYVGTLCVEFFLTRDGSLLVNELAPRPHNSGHLTFDGCITSQFEQQLRAVCGLPPGSTEFYRPVAMANILGDMRLRGTPDWQSVLKDAGVKLHLYGKLEPRPGRKMGHLTDSAASTEDAVAKVRRARAALLKSSSQLHAADHSYKT